MMEFVPSHILKIIVAPLNWGLGHATRSIPIIQQLIDAGKEVVIASDGEALELLKREFPSLPAYHLPGYNVRYTSKNLWGILFKNSTNVMSAIRKEKAAARAIVQETGADMIISDSRFGFRVSGIPSVIISHQLSPIADDFLLHKIINWGNSYLLNLFNKCWVPDDNLQTLSGKLSEPNLIKKVEYIGPLSRLEKVEKSNMAYDISIILSGPEPARSDLESKLASKANRSRKKICFVRGTVAPETRTIFSKHVTVVDLADSAQISAILSSSKQVISRSGYTSIMDYAKMGISAYLIPTPGQSEQVYLAEYHAQTKRHKHIKHITELDYLF